MVTTECVRKDLLWRGHGGRRQIGWSTHLTVLELGAIRAAPMRERRVDQDESDRRGHAAAGATHGLAARGLRGCRRPDTPRPSGTLRFRPIRRGRRFRRRLPGGCGPRADGGASASCTVQGAASAAAGRRRRGRDAVPTSLPGWGLPGWRPAGQLPPKRAARQEVHFPPLKTPSPRTATG